MAFIFRLPRQHSSLRRGRFIKCYGRSLSELARYSHRTEENVIKSNNKVEYQDNVDLFTFFSKQTMKFGDSLAIVDETRGLSTTYTNLLNNSRRLSSFFDQQGYETSQCIAINAPNCLQYSYSALGTVASGMTLAAANSSYTSHELNIMLQSSQPRALITSAQQLDVCRKGLENTSVELIICIDDIDVNDSGVINMSDVLSVGDPNYTKDLSHLDPKTSTSFLLYSSGTTGLPKGVMISHSGVTNSILQSLQFDEHLKPSNVLCFAPMYHIYGLLIITMKHLYHNCTVHVMDAFIPEKFLSVIQEKKIEKVPIVPPIALFMMNHPIATEYDLSSIKWVLIGAAPMDQLTTEQFYKTFPDIIMQQGYGLTETNVTHGQPPYPHLQKAGSCGVVYPGNESKVVSVETGEALGPYEHGEVCCRGPQLMIGYLNNEKATRETIDEEGWLHTGDLGYYDDDLNFYVIDRLKELIKYKGLQIAPAELEDMLLSNNKIIDACVIGVPCDRAGEIPRAYIIKKPDSLITEDEVKEFIAEYLSDHKQLRGGVVFVDEIPKSAAGKLLRRHLKDEYLATLEKNIS